MVILSDAGNDFGDEIVLSATTNVKKMAINNMPKEYALLRNYPNPFNPCTKIPYNLPEQAVISIEIYNLRGNLVRTLWRGSQMAGQHVINWDGTDNNGANVVSGIYFYKLQAGKFINIKKMLRIK